MKQPEVTTETIKPSLDLPSEPMAEGSVLDSGESEPASVESLDLPSEPMAEGSVLDSGEPEPASVESLDLPSEPMAEGSGLDSGDPEPAPVESKASEPKASDSGFDETPHSEPIATVESNPETPESAPSLDTPQARFSAFRTWLDEQGPRYQVWANDCIFIATRPPFLELEFPKGFRHSHVSASDRDELLLQGVEQFFPNCSRVRVRNRSADSDRLTHRETVAKKAAEAQSALEQLIADHADIQSIAAHFDAAIQSVHKDHRAPLPPVLSGEEGA